jgi:hypothetical protein
VKNLPVSRTARPFAKEIFSFGDCEIDRGKSGWARESRG